MYTSMMCLRQQEGSLLQLQTLKMEKYVLKPVVADLNGFISNMRVYAFIG